MRLRGQVICLFVCMYISFARVRKCNVVCAYLMAREQRIMLQLWIADWAYQHKQDKACAFVLFGCTYASNHSRVRVSVRKCNVVCACLLARKQRILPQHLSAHCIFERWGLIFTIKCLHKV